MTDTDYDLAIIGGGVTGTALLYLLSRYTTLKKIVLIEKYNNVATVNSARTHNSQTLHFGDIETNYTLEKSRKVAKAANMVKLYLESEKNPKLFSKYNKMVLAIGSEQSFELRKRYEEFHELFPNLKIINKKSIGELEPMVVKGRPEQQELLALSTDEGYTVDFENLSHSFLENARKHNPYLQTLFKSKMRSLKWSSDHYSIGIGDIGIGIGIGIGKISKTITARVVVVCTGGNALMMAQKLGYGRHLSLLSVAGSFYWAQNVLNGKVYTLQNRKLPFAAIHGDPEVHNKTQIRFGPTAKAIPFLERYNWSSFFDYVKSCGLNFSSLRALFEILSDKVIFIYILRNTLYDLPFIGKRLFIREARKIIPTLKLEQLNFAKGMGGTRPQIVNTLTRKLELGEAKIVGQNIIFNITPSPGASSCLNNAYVDTLKIMEFFKDEFACDKDAIKKDLIDRN
ncbi:MAG: FAD-dependent oxidoreductase [Oligoflexia bacterium]|nr:FAD-dependent oxidoreductase [Oligoflexia bacterium]